MATVTIDKIIARIALAHNISIDMADAIAAQVMQNYHTAGQDIEKTTVTEVKNKVQELINKLNGDKA